jgi:hypothetical protein
VEARRAPCSEATCEGNNTRGVRGLADCDPKLLVPLRSGPAVLIGPNGSPGSRFSGLRLFPVADPPDIMGWSRTANSPPRPMPPGSGSS